MILILNDADSLSDDVTQNHRLLNHHQLVLAGDPWCGWTLVVGSDLYHACISAGITSCVHNFTKLGQSDGNAGLVRVA